MGLDLHTLPDVWPAQSLARSRRASIASGDPRIDDALGGGWPTPALIEVLTEHEGIGELTLLLPLLRSLLCARANTVVLWLNTPHELHALALLQQRIDPQRQWSVNEVSERDAAWAFELALRSGACSAVIGWLKDPSTPTLRRLKLATATGHTTGILFRPKSAAQTASPATIRVVLTPATCGLTAHFIKIQGRRPVALNLDLNARITREAPP